jgi:hypothetical protein
LINRSLVRALVTSVALAGAGALLAGCNGEGISLANNAKANQPVPPKLVADMTAKDMDLHRSWSAFTSRKLNWRSGSRTARAASRC